MLLPLQLLSLVAAILAPIADARSSIRNPLGALSTVDNATIHTPNHRVNALSKFDLTFNVRNQLFVKFQLEPNHDIFPDGASISYFQEDGEVGLREVVNRLDHRVFKGKAWVATDGVDWQQVGWARIMVRGDGKRPFFEGGFSVDHDHHNIQSSTNYLRTKHRDDPRVDALDHGEEYMVVWRDSDILRSTSLQHQDLKRSMIEDVPSCQANVLSFNADPEHPVYRGMMQPPSKSFGFMDFSQLLGKRQIDTTTGGNSAGVNLTSTIGDSSGCPSTNKVALVGVATDCNYAQAFNSTQSLRENVITQMNTASAVWESTFKISLGLQNLTIQPASCPGTPPAITAWNQPCTSSLDIQGRLNDFSAWRGTQADDNSHWTMLSTCNTGSAVGLAWLGQACVNTAFTSNTSSSTGNGASGDGSETVSGANVVVRAEGTNEWQIIAHETGHTYGAVHDCEAQTCADAAFVASQQCCPLSRTTCDANGQYIMNPSASEGITRFSACTVGNICAAIGRNSVNTACLMDNKNVQTITGQQCGNGIVEPGEECDCGGTEGCGDDACCDGATCKLKDGAVCDDANEECCQSCQFKSQGSVCRASTGDCDPQEVCPGNSGNCPPDKTKPNGESCGSGLQCASGQCTSRDQQCKTVMGSYTQGNDTHACDSQGCTISCASPDFGYGVCYGIQQNYLDGTECGGGGSCQNGQCKGSTFGGEVKSWIDDHKAIVIGVCCGVGFLLLLAVIGCIRGCFRRRKMRKIPPGPPPGGWQGWRAPQMEQQRPGQGWYQQPTMSGGRGRNSMPGWDTPPPPPPAYAGRESVRYY